MAEFCLTCLNRMNGTHLTERDVTLGKEFDICEGCGQWKQTVALVHNRRRESRLLRWLKHLKHKA